MRALKISEPSSIRSDTTSQRGKLCLPSLPSPGWRFQMWICGTSSLSGGIDHSPTTRVSWCIRRHSGAKTHANLSNIPQSSHRSFLHLRRNSHRFNTVWSEIEKILELAKGRCSSHLYPKLYRHSCYHLGMPLGRRNRQPSEPQQHNRRLSLPA